MTFKTLRRILDSSENKMQFIEWRNSGIIEAAQLAPNGAIEVVNLISRKRYFIPRRMSNLNIKIVRGMIQVKKLLPKR